MPYIKEICMAGKILEVRKYYTLRYNCIGERRGARCKHTCECQAKVNLRNAERTLRRLMNANFTDDTGMLVTLTYLPKNRPGNSVQMQSDMRNFLKKLRKVFKAGNMILKYIYVKELGKRGAAHVHMLMSVCDVRKLRECWNKGGVCVKPLYSDGDYSDIARYFIKYSADTEKVEGKLIGKRWSASRNLKQPIVIKKIVKANTFNQRIPEKKGYLLDPTSVAEGYTEFGYRYFSYTMRRIEKGG